MKCPLCGYETRVHVRMGECPVRSNPAPEPKDIYAEGIRK